MDKYVDSYNKKIEILFDLLSGQFNINSREKVEELISLYQVYIHKKAEEKKKRNKVIMTIVSVFGGILSISFANMNTIEMNFSSWLYCAIYLSFILAFFLTLYGGYVFLNNLDSLTTKYEMMIKDLKDLLLMKYL